MRPTVAILGAGSMGEILARGLLRAGWDPDNLVMAARREERAREAEKRVGVTTLLDSAEAARDREVVVVSVKPRDVSGLLAQVTGSIDSQQTILSLAAGVPCKIYEDAFGEIPVIRAMPNTPAAVDEAMTAYCTGRYVDDVSLGRAMAVLDAVGTAIQLDEELLDSVTAVSGTGPAYVFLLAEALIEAAIREALPHDAAKKLVEQTLKGAGALVAASDKSPFELRAEVTSPGGTTAAAMHVLEEGGFRALVEDAVRAAAHRSREMGAGAAEEVGRG